MSYPTASLKHMFGESSSPVTVDVAVKQLADAVDTLLAVDLTGASRDELLDLAAAWKPSGDGCRPPTTR